MGDQRLGVGNTRRPRGLAGLLILTGLWALSLTAAPAARAQDATVQGTLTYEKVPATAQGLRLGAIEPKPSPRVVVQVVAPGNKSGFQIIARGVTDDNGFYQIPVSLAATTTVYILIRAQADNATVYNPSTGSGYAVSGSNFSLAPGATVTRNLVIPDSGRLSGPFNVLAVIVAANKRVRAALPGVVIPPVLVAWATNFRNGGDFQPPDTIALNGDRNVNSDEFDDAVIGHELGHFFQTALSRDDSFGGQHTFGERLDPPTAFSEGWATGHGQTLLNDPNYIDTFGTNATQAFVINVEPDTPSVDQPGYWSEYTIASTLWDLAKTGLGYPALFKSLAALANVTDAYFIDYCDELVRGNRDRADIIDALTNILAAHTIIYTAGAIPSVSNPFRAPLVPSKPLTGTLNSTVPAGRQDRENLYDARSVSTFILTSPTNVDLLLQITSSKTPTTSDLDLLLFDAKGALITFSATANGVGGQERITRTLPAGTYRVDVWSFWFDSTAHYNSADYVLTLTTS
jgi:hypothetical protein